MQLQYVTNNQGQKNAVLLSIIDWKNIQRKLNEFEKLKIYKEKNTFFSNLKNAIDESKLHSEGKIKLQTDNDFLDEL